MAWHYETTVTWQGGEQGVVAAAGRTPLAFTPPAEFGGGENEWNPELLLAGSVETCLLLTALHFVNKMKIDLKSYTSKAVAEMERTPHGLRFQKMTVTIAGVVGNAEDVERFQHVIASAEKWCPVSNAVNFPVHVTAAARVG